MDSPVIVLVLLIMAFTFAFSSTDLQRNQNMKSDTFESVRVANQNGLYDIRDKYSHYDEITTSEMLESWLINFCNTNRLDYSDIKVTFSLIETEPIPLYLCKVEAKDAESYRILKGKEPMVSYYNGTMLIPDEGEPDIEEPGRD